MAGVLTLASIVTCAHSGLVATSSSAKLNVGGSAVLLRDGVEGKSVACAANTPCTKVSSVTAGEASKLNADGKPVLLDTLAGLTDRSVPIKAGAGQTKLTAS